MKYLMLLIVLPGLLATTYKELSIDDILTQAEIGFYGTVSEVRVEERDGDPWTVVSFEILSPLLGIDEGTESWSFSFYGGSLEDQTLSVSLMPQFSPAETVLIFAYDQEFYSPIVGFRQGLWRETTLGLRDELERTLSLDEEGKLNPNGEGAATEELLEAFRKALEARP